MTVRKLQTKKSSDVVEIEIETGMTPQSRVSGYIKNWPIDKLKVGQSFFVTMDEGQKEGSMRHALQVYCKKNGMAHNRNYTFNKTVKDNEHGFRIFRLDGEYQGERDEAEAA